MLLPFETCKCMRRSAFLSVAGDALQLATSAWVKAGHPLCLIGDSGTGKSHLLIGLGTAAAESGYRVRYTLASKLVNELAEAADDKQLTRTVARWGRVDPDAAGLLAEIRQDPVAAPETLVRQRYFGW